MRGASPASTRKFGIVTAGQNAMDTKQSDDQEPLTPDPESAREIIKDNFLFTLPVALGILIVIFGLVIALAIW